MAKVIPLYTKYYPVLLKKVQGILIPSMLFKDNGMYNAHIGGLPFLTKQNNIMISEKTNNGFRKRYRVYGIYGTDWFG